jgi:hypothetical protein
MQLVSSMHDPPKILLYKFAISRDEQMDENVTELKGTSPHFLQYSVQLTFCMPHTD